MLLDVDMSPLSELLKSKKILYLRKDYPKLVVPEMGKGIISLNWIGSRLRPFFLSKPCSREYGGLKPVWWSLLEAIWVSAQIFLIGIDLMGNCICHKSGRAKTVFAPRPIR